MEFTRIYFIINPSAGHNEPVVDIIERVFKDSRQQLTIHVLKKGEHAATIVREAMDKADLIAVYGGDGSVTEAAAALINGRTPLAIIPGGTANVLATELGIPRDTETTLKLIRDGQTRLKTMDTGRVNDRPFLLRVNLGIMADMITGTDPDLKDKIGQLAYGVSTIKSIYNAEPVDYVLQIDGKEVKSTGTTLTVTNSGSMGIGGLQLQPGISIDDGLLDVLLLKDDDVLTLVKAAGASLLGQETDAIAHWRCREITITMPHEQTYLCDDCEGKAKVLVIKIVPASLSVVVPLAN